MKVIPLDFGHGPVDVDGPDIACEVKRSKRKTLAIHVKHGKVEVRAPFFTSQREINQFLDLHRHWIVERLQQEAERDRESLVLETGRHIFYQARELRLELRDSPHRDISVPQVRHVPVRRIDHRSR